MNKNSEPETLNRESDNTTTCMLCGAVWNYKPSPLIMGLHMLSEHPLELMESETFQHFFTKTLYDFGGKIADSLRGKND